MAGKRPDWEEEELDGGVAAFLESEEAAWVPGEEAAGDGVLIPEWVSDFGVAERGGARSLARGADRGGVEIEREGPLLLIERSAELGVVRGRGGRAVRPRAKGKSGKAASKSCEPILAAEMISDAAERFPGPDEGSFGESAVSMGALYKTRFRGQGGKGAMVGRLSGAEERRARGAGSMLGRGMAVRGERVSNTLLVPELARGMLGGVSRHCMGQRGNRRLTGGSRRRLNGGGRIGRGRDDLGRGRSVDRGCASSFGEFGGLEVERIWDIAPAPVPSPAPAVFPQGNLAEDDGEIPGPSQWEAWRNDAPVTAGRGRREQLYMDDVLPVEPEQTGAASEPMTVWIIGHSFTYWGHRHACGRPYGPHLDLQRRGVRVIWLGRRGMLWDELVPYVRKERERRAAPRVLVVHLGGNDWGKMSGKHFISNVRKDLMTISILLPTTILCWSDIVVRPAELDNIRWKRCRSKANQQIGTWLERLGGRHIKYAWSWGKVTGLFRDDGVHLSFLGLDLFLNSIQEVLEELFPL
ncbi:uncharacterized protein LOC115093905 [Rhinatrema bivittatum]|uniref:uncharacterized protein LOC115085463 n=2 Tax=Rhinatrema bivittatum TaxID=194408 RepID=UPI00112A32E7|nr:uncharacterized protein LOC115085463 [Rhinatrema bivittatum]XP_029461280.1 uncharacterized protein LOC115093553 [Rhinatrema bivittatum]XP_029462177.1 uncharacterized protein LOC115093905 [Rhinatrema bivittatum]